MSMGMGWGSLQGRKKGPGTLCLETQREEKKGEESINLEAATAKVNPGSWRLSIRIHSTKRAKSQNQRLGGGGLLSPEARPGEVGSGPSLFLRTGVTWGLHICGTPKTKTQR